jgi:hypothetical protein
LKPGVLASRSVIRASAAGEDERAQRRIHGDHEPVVERGLAAVDAFAGPAVLGPDLALRQGVGDVEEDEDGEGGQGRHGFRGCISSMPSRRIACTVYASGGPRAQGLELCGVDYGGCAGLL